MKNKPDFLQPNGAGIPRELKSIPRWVLWRANKKDGKWTKVPMQVNGDPAKTNDPATWADFQTAWKAYYENAETFDGLGLVLNGDGLVGIDMDHVVAGGKIKEEARRIVEIMAGTYTELSPSGTGIRIFCRGDLPDGGRKKGDFEFYESGRYLTITGKSWNGSAPVADMAEAVSEAYRRVFGSNTPKEPPRTPGASGPWRERLERAFKSKTGAEIKRLWDGSDQDGDHSADDLALCSHLAFWLSGDPAAIDAAFRESGLMRKKWDEKHFSDGRTYGQATIQKAVAGCREFYQERTRTAERDFDSANLRNNISQPEADKKSLLFVPADSIEPEPVNWLWRGWIAKGKFHLSAGKPGSGKTTTALSLAAIVSSGGSWPDGTQATAGDVLIWSGEDDPADTIVPRLIAMGANLSRCHILRGVRDGEDVRPFEPERDMGFLRAAVQSVRFSLMIIDPIILVVKGDSHKNAEVRKSLQPLADMAEQYDCAVYGITHFNKGSSGQDPLERLTGSVAFGAVVRIAYASSKYEEEEEEGTRLFARIKNNIGLDGGGFKYRLDVCRLEQHQNIEVVRVAWLEAVSGSARDLIEAAEWKPEEPTREDQAAEWLRSRLSGGPVRSDVIMTDAIEAGFSEKTIRRAKKKLNIDSEKSSFAEGGHWIWLIKGGR